MPVDKRVILEFVRAHPLGVVSTTSENGAPEAALVNIVSTDELELIFYTLQTNRKCINLRRDPRIAVVIGWDNEKTMQYEGVADEPRDEELDRLKRIYGAARANAEFKMLWPGLTYFRVKPKWIRLSNYSPKWSLDEISFP